MPTTDLIRELPTAERPRERLLQHGGAALSDAELLAVLLRTGRPGASVLSMAVELLRENGGLAGLAETPPRSLLRRGLGAAKLASVLAALEVGRRLARARLPERDPMAHPADVVSYLAMRYRPRDQEVMGALFLDGKNRLLGERELFRGTMNRAAVEPREILKEGLLRGAASIIVFHTHPSGDPAPSAEDLLFTRRMAEAGEAVGIVLMEHLILGAGGRWVSLKPKEPDEPVAASRRHRDR